MLDQPKIIFLIVLTLLYCNITTGSLSEDLQQYEDHVSHCEYSALRLGSEIADLFNSPVGSQDWDERIHQDYIVEKLGFAPFMENGISSSNGKTLQNHNAKELYQKNGWGGKDIANSPYAYLNHKWIYMFGDSTTRQIWASFAAPFQGNHFERNAKEWTRHYCNGQSHRVRHGKHDNADNQGWRGPCGVNEVTCHVSGYGDKGILSFDWKHFPYEDYDEWFWGQEGPWLRGFHGEGVRRPDVLTIQLGLHSCWHSNPEGLYSKHIKEINQTMVNAHLADVSMLMQRIRYAVDHPPVDKNINGSTEQRTTVIVLTSGSSGMGDAGISIDNCIHRFNSVAMEAAHSQGFAVLDRGEIERRLMHKSYFSDRPYLKNDMHLPQPAQNLIATCLLNLMSCLSTGDRNYNITEALLHRQVRNRNTPRSVPLHTPPSA